VLQEQFVGSEEIEGKLQQLVALATEAQKRASTATEQINEPNATTVNRQAFGGSF
jgi:hypothetical protein